MRLEKHQHHQIYSCDLCEYNTKVLSESKIHKDTEHLSVQVNVKNLKEVRPLPSQECETDRVKEMIRCDKCNYECRLNIQLRKHTQSKHAAARRRLLYCDKCDFKCDVIVTLNKHKLDCDAKKIYQCDSCDYQGENETKLIAHKKLTHKPNINQDYQCDECELKTTNINKLVQHKRTLHGVLRYACDQCNHTDSILEGLWRHKIDSHQSYEANDVEGTFQMQQMLLISLSAQVEFLVQSMARVNVEIGQGFEENRTKMDNIEGNIEQLDCKVNDLGVAIAKTSRFDTKIQNDSQAVLTRVSDKCATIENLVLSRIKVTQTATNPNKVVNDGTEAKADENVVPKRNKARKEISDDRNKKKKKVAWVGTSLSKQLIKSRLEEDLKVDLNVERAYCIENEPDAHFSDRNFRAVVPKAIENENVETLVLQTGSIEITNINVNKATKDPKKNIEEYKKQAGADLCQAHAKLS